MENRRVSIHIHTAIQQRQPSEGFDVMGDRSPFPSDGVEMQEGQATFQVGSSFYRPDSARVRDLGVLAGAVYRSQVGQLRVLDAMAASGVRSLRYYLEAGADWIWANDGNPETVQILQANLAQHIAPERYQVSQLDANQVCFDCYRQRDFYDLVDMDVFGRAAPYLGSALWAVALGGLLYITSTDGRGMGGRSPHSTLATYAAYARSHPSLHEQGLRLLIGSAQQLAAARGFGVEPIVSYWSGQAWRVMLRLQGQSQLSERTYGFLGYCHHCGNYQMVSWKMLGRACCPQDGQRLSLSGPLWLGPLHSPTWLSAMGDLAQSWEWEATATLLAVMGEEADMPPYFFPLGEIGRRGNLDLPGRSPLLHTLQSWGYRASRTHLNPQAIKTDAPLNVCIQAAKNSVKTKR